MMFNQPSILTKDVPSDWNLRKIKYVFNERKETNDPVKTDLLISLTHDRGVIPHSEKGDIGNKEKDDLTKYKLVYPGDIVVNSMNVIIGSSGLSHFYGLVSPVYYMLVLKDQTFDNKYFHYLFRSLDFQKSLIGVGNGILEHRMRVPMDKLGNQFIPVPDTQEQKLISRYLDKRTEQIDYLIKKIQKKIELLKEQRTALINQCFTKGLDPNVEMKDSGIQWIGEIPGAWKVKKLKYAALVNPLKDDLHKISDEPVVFLPMDKVSESGKIDCSIRKPVSSLWSSFTFFRKNDVIVAKITPCFENGKTALLNELATSVGFGSTEFHVLRPREQIDSKFLYYVIKSEIFRKIGTAFMSGAAGQKRVPTDFISDFPLVLPSKEEQTHIAQYLDKEISRIDSLIEKETKRIALLKEYRQSLISNVVTGKVKVTDETA